MRYEIALPETGPALGVYAFLDGVGAPLYIGRTGNLLTRTKQHASTADWWHRVRAVEWTPCASLAETRRVEKSLIADFHSETSNVADVRPVPKARTTLPGGTQMLLRALLTEERDGHLGRSRSELTGYMAALHGAGWALAAISEPLAMTREGVRKRIAQSAAGAPPYGIPCPPAMHGPKFDGRRALGRRPIPADVAARLVELNATAQRVRGHSSGDKKRLSSEFTTLIADLVTAGHAVADVAEVIGVTRAAVTMRLQRHGWAEPFPSTSGVPFGTTPASRVPRGAVCLKGHPADADNVRFINGDPSRRVCRTCERVRVARYRTKQTA